MCCYLASKKLDANYLSLKNNELIHSAIHIEDLFGISPESETIFFAFEATFMPYQKFINGRLPRTDLVIQNKKSGHCLRGLEVKLTALPDNTTHKLNEKEYGSEIVIRPDTIVYLACSIASSIGGEIESLKEMKVKIKDWSEPNQVLEHFPEIILRLKKVLSLAKKQEPFLLQPIWKTRGKSPELADNCLDVFCWSDMGFLYFMTEIVEAKNDIKAITRQIRALIWLFKMLYDISLYGSFDLEDIIDKYSYNTKNDKAFASAGNITNKFMSCKNLTNPRIHKKEIKNIIIGGGQELLSPERRFDAIIYNSPELFL